MLERSLLYAVLVISISLGSFAHHKLIELVSGEDPSTINAIPSVDSVKRFSLGFDQLIADYYWLRFISYVGDAEASRKDNYASAGDYIRLITALDPHFVSAYWFAAFTIGGDARRPKEAAEILDKGIEHNADIWSLPFIAGINQFLYAGEPAAAARYYRMAAKYPDSPSWLARQADILEADAPKLVKQAYSWTNIYESAVDGPVREHARERCIWYWVQLYKTAPNEKFRSRAKVSLAKLGVDVSLFRKTGK